MRKQKPHRLERGQKIGIVAPASPVPENDSLTLAVSRVEKHGYEALCGNTTRPGPGYLSGSDRERMADLERIWLEESTGAVWAIRGGYGCLRLLPYLCGNLFKNNPKALIGFSDLTALELSLWSQIRLVTMHGPTLSYNAGEDAIDLSFEIIEGAFTKGLYQWPKDQVNYQVIRGGKAQGVILGGNLATITSMIGGKYFPDFEGALLFLEEVGEDIYRIDRMLTQLLLSGALDAVAAIIVGESVPVAGQNQADLAGVFRERLKKLSCPIGYGFPIGHLAEQWTIPQGILGEVNTSEGSLGLLENPVLGGL